MARTRTLSQLREDVRKRADIEGADDRHSDADLTRYINQGAAELRDLQIASRGRTYFRKPTPQTITTVDGQTRYALNADFLRLISVRVSSEGGASLEPFAPEDEPDLRTDGVGGLPTHYELQPGHLEFLPPPSAGHTIVVEYIPAHTDLVADGDTLDGYDGWEEYVVVFAARCVAKKDADWDLSRELKGDLADLRVRIQQAVPHRDGFRAERVKDVRGTRPFLGRRFR